MTLGAKSRATHRLLVLLGIGPSLIATSARVSSADTCGELREHFTAVVSGTTAGTSSEAGSCGGAEAPEARFLFTAPRAGMYTFDTLGSSFDTVLYIRDGNNAELSCNDDVELGVHAWSRVAVLLAAGQTVHVVVDGFASQGGDFALRVNAECPLPFRADARDLGSSGTWVITGRTNCAAAVGPSGLCGTVPWGRGASFVYTAPFSGTFEFSTEGSDFDTLLAVRLGTCSGAELACNDDAEPNGEPGGQSRVRVDLFVGQSVVLVVAGKSTATGHFVLSGSGVPFTPTVTATRTRTRTPTATRTDTPRPTPTNSPTFSPIRTRSPTLTPSPTFTFTSSRTPTVTRSPTRTRSIAWTPTPTVRATSTATVTPTISLTVGPLPSVTPTSPAGASPTLVELGCCEFAGDTSPRCEMLGREQCIARGGAILWAAECSEQEGCISPTLPTATRTATPSPTPTTTMRSDPTLTLVPSGTPTPTAAGMLEALPRDVRPGASLMVSGRVPPGNAGVRLWLDNGGPWLMLSSVGVDETWTYSTNVVVPRTVAAGPARLCAAATDPGLEGRDLVCTNVTVGQPEGASVSILATFGAEPVPGAWVYLIGEGGFAQVVAATDIRGVVNFDAVPSGVYGVRIVCGNASACPEGVYFPPARVILGPGTRRTLAVHGVMPPESMGLDWVGALVLPGGLAGEGLLGGRLLLPAEPWIFPSLAGLGLPPLVVRFWAVPTVSAAAAGELTFRFVNADGVSVSTRAGWQSSVYSLDSRWNFPAYVADVNVAALEGGDILFVIEPQVGPPQGFVLKGEPLSPRWAGMLQQPGNYVETGLAGEILRTAIRGKLFHPQWQWDLKIPVGSGGDVRWAGSVGAEVLEEWRSDEQWSGTVVVDATLKFGEQSALPNSSFSALTGTRIADARYQVAANLAFGGCVDLQQPEVQASLPVSYCESCPASVFEEPVRSSNCVRPNGELRVDMTADLSARGSFDLGFSQLGWRSFEEPLGLCRAQWWGLGRVGSALRVHYDSKKSPATFVEDPVCLAVSERWNVLKHCAGRAFGGAAVESGQPLPCSVAVQDEHTSDPWNHPQPVLGRSKLGQTLLLWLEPVGVPPLNSAALRWARVDNSTSVGTGSALSAGDGPADSPTLTALDEESVLAVWVQSVLQREVAVGAPQGSLTASAELVSALWNNGSWSEPTYITRDDVADGKPVLVGHDSGAELFWLRATEPQLGGRVAVHAARYDRNLGWIVEGSISPQGGGLVRDLTGGVVRGGTVVVSWIEDFGSRGASVWVRQRVGGAWLGTDNVSLPNGVRPSMVRVVDNGAVPTILIRAVAHDSLGPGGDLYVATLESQGWSVRRILQGKRVDTFWAVETDPGIAVFFREVPGGSVVEGNGNLWVALVRGPAVYGPVRLTADGEGHSSPFGSVRGEGEVLIADVHQQLPNERPRVSFHRHFLLPDLRLEDIGWRSDPEGGRGELGDPSTLLLRVVNHGLQEVRGPFSVRLRVGSEVLRETQIHTDLPVGAGVDVVFELREIPTDVDELVILVDEDNNVAESDKDNNLGRVSLRPAVPVVRGYTADGGSGDVTLEWSPVARARHYRIYRLNPAAKSFELWAVTTETKVRDRGAFGTDEVVYRVTAVDAVGRESDPSPLVRIPASIAVEVCPGDCDGDGVVTIDELLLGVNIALELRTSSDCSAFDVTRDMAVTVDEILLAVRSALIGCR